MSIEKREKKAFSNIAFGVISALAVTAVFSVATFVSTQLKDEGFPSPEDLQEETGFEVYVFPEGRPLNEVGEYCILIGSTPSAEEDRLGNNPLEDVCSASIVNDLDEESYGGAELSDLCVDAGGSVDLVYGSPELRFNADAARSACVTNTPIS